MLAIVMTYVVAMIPIAEPKVEDILVKYPELQPHVKGRI